ncbi:metal ABC transporter substrate-binding protein [soil metagenome]
MNRSRIAAFSLAMALTIWLIPGHQAGTAQTEPIKVAATFSILADLVQNVGGDLVQVETIVKANMDAHTFEPSPQEVIAVTDASIIFEIGLDFEPWLDGIVEASQAPAARVVVSDGIALRAASDHGDEVHDDEAHDDEAHDDEAHDDSDHGHEHGEFDPHVWHDVMNAGIMVQNIADALAEADPQNADQYQQQAAAYQADLDELDAWIFEAVSAVPEDHRKMVTSHDTFGYYADRYGFEILGTPLGISTETSDPAAGEIAALIEAIQDSGVPAIFTENVSSSAVIDQIANDASVIVAPPLFTDALGEPESEGATYVEMMRYNTETIVEALVA